ncbi:MAG: CDP-diacylglycerol--glycerol-3-phosphate 3-phosphatidyltransferase [Nitriliruptorales bacterium]
MSDSAPAPDEDREDPGGHVHVVPPEDLPGPSWLSASNALTFVRVLLVPVIVGLLVVDSRAARWWAFGVYAFAALTDLADGWFARRGAGETRWGQIADPVADKILVLGTLAALAWLTTLPWWAVTVILLREVAVTILRVNLVRGRDVVMPASRWGKSKTVSQLVAVGVYIVPDISLPVRLALLYVAVGLTVVSGVEYAFRAGRLARGAGDRG